MSDKEPTIYNLDVFSTSDGLVLRAVPADRSMGPLMAVYADIQKLLSGLHRVLTDPSTKNLEADAPHFKPDHVYPIGAAPLTEDQIADLILRRV